MNKFKPIITIIGTTGAGKTKLSIQLAKRFNGEIINADIMQMYKGLPITTNKVPLHEMEGIPHHLLDFVEPDTEYMIHHFKRDALKIVPFFHPINR